MRIAVFSGYISRCPEQRCPYIENIGEKTTVKFTVLIFVIGVIAVAVGIVVHEFGHQADHEDPQGPGGKQPVSSDMTRERRQGRQPEEGGRAVQHRRRQAVQILHNALKDLESRGRPRPGPERDKPHVAPYDQNTHDQAAPENACRHGPDHAANGAVFLDDLRDQGYRRGAQENRGRQPALRDAPGRGRRRVAEQHRPKMKRDNRTGRYQHAVSKVSHGSRNPGVGQLFDHLPGQITGGPENKGPAQEHAASGPERRDPVYPADREGGDPDQARGACPPFHHGLGRALRAVSVVPVQRGLQQRGKAFTQHASAVGKPERQEVEQGQEQVQGKEVDVLVKIEREPQPAAHGLHQPGDVLSHAGYHGAERAEIRRAAQDAGQGFESQTAQKGAKKDRHARAQEVSHGAGRHNAQFPPHRQPVKVDLVDAAEERNRRGRSLAPVHGRGPRVARNKPDHRALDLVLKKTARRHPQAGRGAGRSADEKPGDSRSQVRQVEIGQPAPGCHHDGGERESGGAAFLVPDLLVRVKAPAVVTPVKIADKGQIDTEIPRPGQNIEQASQPLRPIDLAPAAFAESLPSQSFLFITIMVSVKFFQLIFGVFFDLTAYLARLLAVASEEADNLLTERTRFGVCL